MTGIVLIAPALWASIAGQAPKLTLDDALKIAEQNAFSVRLAQSDVEKTRQRVAEAKGRIGPQASVNTVYTRNEKAIKSGDFIVQPLETTQSQFVLSMPLDITGVLHRGVRASSAAISVSKENLAAEKNNLRLDVRSAYFDVLQAQAQVKVFEDALDSAQKRLKNTQLEFEAGAKAKVDVMRVDTEVHQSQTDLINARNFLTLARNNFNNTLGRPIETPFELEEPGNLPTPEGDEKTLTETAENNRPEVRALRFNQKVLELIRTAEEGGMLPSLNLQGIHSRNWSGSSFGSAESSTFARVTLAVPVWDSGVTRARVKQARQDEEQNRIRLEQTQLGISFEVRQALTNLTSAKARLDTAASQVELAAETFRLAGIRYEAGEAILLEVTDAQTELTRAKSQLVTATYDYWTAYAQLQRALGTDVPKPTAPTPSEEKK
jgi:outer membrane protein